MAPDYSGRLELTWTNKHLRLLSREDGGYEWVPPADYRVAEVRLLRDAGTTGETHADAERAQDNLLIRGDALSALQSLASLPEFRDEVVGKVKLAYLDPPFNTGQAFAHYDDALEHSVWLTMMRDRLQQIRKLLAPDGSVWVHCDDTEQAHLKVAMDEIFGRENFIATVVWQRQASQSNMAVVAQSHDYIVCFARERAQFAAARNRLQRTDEQDALYTNPDNDPRGPWTSGPVQARNAYSLGRYAITTPSGRVISGPPRGTYWRISEQKLRELDEDNRIWWGPKGDGVPRVKRFLTEVEGVVPKTWWPYQESGTTDQGKRESKALTLAGEPFSTPKPERLMHRIIHIASNPGDLVLDCFAGSGTTAAVAHKLGRRWITVEWSRATVETFTAPRLAKVVTGEDPGGITKEAAWEGGGGFRVLDVAPSMLEAEQGQVLLADWALGTDLSEATAAQLGFAYDPELLPFCGRKGRMRLAVVDGLVNEAVARLLLQELPEEETLCVCGTMIDPDVRGILRAKRPGSTVRKVPESILADYRLGQLWWDAQAAPLPPEEGAGEGGT